MKNDQRDLISVLAAVGSVTLVLGRITWHVINRQWTPALMDTLVILLVAICIGCSDRSPRDDSSNDGSR